MRGSPRIVGVDTHIDAPLLTHRHDRLEEIGHILAQLRGIDTVIEFEQIAEFLDGILIVLRDIAAHEALGLDNDILYETLFSLGGHGRA